MHTWRVIGAYVVTYWKSKLIYRANFWVDVFSDMLFLVTNLTFIYVLFAHTNELDGWSREQIVFIYGYFMVPWGIFCMVFNLWDFTEKYIIKGEMDRILTRPVHALVQLILENIEPSQLITSLVGLGMMGVTWSMIGISFSWWDIPMLLLLVVGSVMIYGGIYLTLIAISFFSDSPTGIMPLMWNIQSYGRYPITIYNTLFKITLTWVVPFAFVGFYPATYFLRSDAYTFFVWLTPVMGAVCLSVALFIWHRGILRYRGAGS